MLELAFCVKTNEIILPARPHSKSKYRQAQLKCLSRHRILLKVGFRQKSFVLEWVESAFLNDFINLSKKLMPSMFFFLIKIKGLKRGMAWHIDGVEKTEYWF